MKKTLLIIAVVLSGLHIQAQNEVGDIYLDPTISQKKMGYVYTWNKINDIDGVKIIKILNDNRIWSWSYTPVAEYLSEDERLLTNLENQDLLSKIENKFGVKLILVKEKVSDYDIVYKAEKGNIVISVMINNLKSEGEEVNRFFLLVYDKKLFKIHEIEIHKNAIQKVIDIKNKFLEKYSLSSLY